MDVQALATTPIFVISLTLCALVTAYAFTVILRSTFGGLSSAAASVGLQPEELQAVEQAGIFHQQLEALIEKVVATESLSQELPGPFRDHSWERLLTLCDNLEIARGELNELLASRDFHEALALGRFLTGSLVTPPPIPRPEGSFELRLLCYWQKEAKDLLHRMVSKIDDSLRYGIGGATQDLSEEFHETFQEIKADLVSDD